MLQLLGIFADSILPILIVALIGLVFQRLLDLDPRPLSQLLFYVLSPALVFDALTRSEIGLLEIARMGALAAAIVVLIILLSLVIGRLLKLDRKMMAAFILAGSLINAGNYGLPLNQFAFGAEAFSWASLYFVASYTMMNSVGIYVASAGKLPPQKALAELLRAPAVYAIPAALLVMAFNLQVPPAILRPVELLSGAAVPVMLLLLGMQIGLSGIPQRKGVLATAVAIRLLISPALAWLLTPGFQLSGAAMQAAITQSAMPTAVYAIVLATKFDVETEFVTSVVLTTTLLSPLTVTPLIAILNGVF